MDWIIPCIFGWSGGVIIIVIRPFPWPRPGPDCIVCGGLLGSIAAVILEQMLRPVIVNPAFGDRALFDLAAGFAVASAVRGIVSLVGRE